jgi:hypothetical protein
MKKADIDKLIAVLNKLESVAETRRLNASDRGTSKDDIEAGYFQGQQNTAYFIKRYLQGNTELINAIL